MNNQKLLSQKGFVKLVDFYYSCAKVDDELATLALNVFLAKVLMEARDAAVNEFDLEINFPVFLQAISTNLHCREQLLRFFTERNATFEVIYHRIGENNAPICTFKITQNIVMKQPETGAEWIASNAQM